ncbi:Fc.00g084190.m01.CDS01 [Cosmosporella sp. VM-42]
MPTAHVAPDSQEVLQAIADSLFKSRKVVVVTGAGISTNSGIPDFRSENGLYSLIQAQFDAAAQARQVEHAVQQCANDVDDFEDGRAKKRRRISRESTVEGTVESIVESTVGSTIEVTGELEDTNTIEVTAEREERDSIDVTAAKDRNTIEVDAEMDGIKDEIQVDGEEDVKDQIRVGSEDGIEDQILVGMKDEIEVQGDHTTYVRDEDISDCIVLQPEERSDSDPSEPPEADVAETIPIVLRRSGRHSITVAQPMTSPLSSPPPEDLKTPPSAFRKHARNHGTDVEVHPSSSPLSSPPPMLFDPFAASSPSNRNSCPPSSTSPSEVDEVEEPPIPINPFSASQSSNSGRTLPNMKGKDLFDASIWADPLRTAVFYTFATSLRQKVKEVEPTSSHRFISHLRDRGKLVRCYTQNIDQIEEKVGLSTSLQDGPGSRGRFSRKSTANRTQLSKMVEEASAPDTDLGSANKLQQSSDDSLQQTQSSQADGTVTPISVEGDHASSDISKVSQKHPRRELPRSGVECVFLHGSLEQLRCFLCGRVCSWDDDCREQETLSGQQPECPHCVGATTAREEKGKRALGVGKLRPDIVLYGEEHPNAHLISPIVTHDLALCPDMLLILGTSLRVHGLKVMVREFAKAVHAKGGKVVFVNFTKPPESSWGDVIDYWIEWDCDAWVSDLQDKIPKFWQAPELPKPKKKRESNGVSDDNEKEEKKRPPPANPVALRDTKATGAYWTPKIVECLHSITGHNPRVRRASISTTTTTKASGSPLPKVSKPRAKRPRKSAPGALERPMKTRSTLNPNHGRLRQGVSAVTPMISPEALRCVKKEIRSVLETSSILHSVKKNPRIRKKTKIDGEEVVMPTVGKRKPATKKYTPTKAELILPPLKPQDRSPTLSGFSRPEPLEPQSPPHGPLASISPNLRSAAIFGRDNAYYIQDAIKGLRQPPSFPQMQREHRRSTRMDRPPSRDETDAVMGLIGLCKGEAGPADAASSSPSVRDAREALRGWGGRWVYQKQ